MHPWYSNYAQNHKTRLAFDLEALNHQFPNPEGVKMLELGALPFILSVGAQKMGYEVVALDRNPDRFSRVLKENQLQTVAFDLALGTLPFEDATFDVLVMNEVLEHLNLNLSKLFKELLRVLRPEGVLMLSTPNLRSAMGFYNFMFRGIAYSCAKDLFEEYAKEETLGHMGHVREYTPREVIGFLKKTGFEVSELRYRGRFSSKILVDRVFPKLKPYFSVTAHKPASF